MGLMNAESMSMLKPRLRAMAIHGGLSLAVALLAAALVFWVWFPGDLAFLLRGGELFLLLTACDVVLGPVLSFVVCSPGKSRRSLVFDYAVIVAIQVAALVYGMAAVADARPAYLVLTPDRFELANAGEVGRSDPRDVEGLARLPMSWTGYRLATLSLPTSAQAHNEALSLEVEQGVDLHTLPRYLRPYDPSEAAPRLHALDDLARAHPEARPEVERLLQRRGVEWHQAAWLPLRTRYGFHTVVLGSDAATVLGFLALDPY